MPDATALPSWIAEADRLLREASRRTTPISSATPRNLRVEHARVAEAWGRGEEATPRFDYAPFPDLAEFPRALSLLAEKLKDEGPLGAIYAERADELSLDAQIVASVGTPTLPQFSRRRFGYRDRYSADADLLAAEWAKTESEPDDIPSIMSDDATNPGSLVSRIRAEVGANRLSVRIVVSRNLAPLAAVGDGIIQIAEGRLLSARDRDRTVLHEIQGHLIPQSRAVSERLGIFSIATQRGSDDQEGRALSLERRAGFLTGARRAELARRHVAARAVLEGSHFVETTRLLRSLDAPLEDCVRLALRAHRGAHLGLGGLAREIVYLPAMLRVEARLASDPSAEDVLARGRVAVAAVDALRPFLARS